LTAPLLPPPPAPLCPYTTLFRSPLRGSVAVAQQPEIFLLADVREVPNEGAHQRAVLAGQLGLVELGEREGALTGGQQAARHGLTDRKSTRLNSSHSQISYAVFCL